MKYEQCNIRLNEVYSRAWLQTESSPIRFQGLLRTALNIGKVFNFPVRSPVLMENRWNLIDFELTSGNLEQWKIRFKLAHILYADCI